MTAARQRLGEAGEQRAARWYERQGYTVVDRNWRCRDGELDIILTRGDTLVICEVKTRSSLAYGHPAEAVTVPKQQRIRKLATLWLREQQMARRPSSIRFDVAAVLPTGVEVIEAAF